ncbi:MAG: hypothetical protein IPJ61_17500 [Tessaracoccus sp.]|uniref:hypothetical protein n=1 Tax=Tessaracoccus sp. TaxID=1971211 RepID=UPI001EB12A03|nr:hypothetical protein [Tessaracoccus sp.]MBK7822802.1 hypothetical protein [Tessaracoccus sp.]
MSTNQYRISSRAANLFMIRRNGELAGSATSQAEAEAKVAAMRADDDALAARNAARQAKVGAYAAAGLQIRADIPNRAARYRRHTGVIVVDAEGQTVATYAHIDEVPEIEAPAVIETAEAETTTEAPAVPVRGSITDDQVATVWALVEQERHLGSWFAGPDTLDGIRAMSAADAADYIRSMTEEN